MPNCVWLIQEKDMSRPSSWMIAWLGPYFTRREARACLGMLRLDPSCKYRIRKYIDEKALGKGKG